MKRFLPLSLAALAALLLLSSCVYDPLYSGYGGSNYYDYGYNGGYYNGVYSDFYVGYSNNYYRYRHTRCSHCNYYPCRGGHTTHYYTYYRNYRKPLYDNPHRGHGSHGSYASNHGSGQHQGHRPSARPSSYSSNQTGSNYRGADRYGSTNNKSVTSHRPDNYPTRGGSSANFGTMRNSTPYTAPSRNSSPGSSRPSGSRPGGSSNRGNAGPSPHSVTSNSPGPSRTIPTSTSSQPAPSKSAPATSSEHGGRGSSGNRSGVGQSTGRKAGKRN